MRLLPFVLFLLASPALAADLDVIGACPGPVTLRGSGFTPNASVFLARSDVPGPATVPAGPCLGTPLGISPPRYLASVRTDASGAFVFRARVPAAACGAALQAIDGSSCLTSDVEGLSAVSSCMIDMDASCPDVTPQCGATFSGAGDCIVPNFATCTTTGSRSYVIPAGQTVRIDFDEDVNEFQWLLATLNGGTTLMTTFDENGNAMGTSGSAGFECDVGPTSESTADVFRPWRAVEITAVGGEAYLDSVLLNDR